MAASNSSNTRAPWRGPIGRSARRRGSHEGGRPERAPPRRASLAAGDFLRQLVRDGRQPEEFNRLSAAARAPAASRSESSQDSSMFSSTVSAGSRLVVWKTKPIWSGRSRSRDPSAGQQTRPEVGISSPPMTCSEVDLPCRRARGWPSGRLPAPGRTHGPELQREPRRLGTHGSRLRARQTPHSSPTTLPHRRGGECGLPIWLAPRCGVAMTAAPPSARKRSSNSRICCSVAASTSPVGSSASRILGVTARAICRVPPVPPRRRRVGKGKRGGAGRGPPL